ncbi:MAG: hypothetical protein HC875_32325 [Anaerolineales bacterium]|nr:hypothetical protein [Anaerolineales bacterium]
MGVGVGVVSPVGLGVEVASAGGVVEVDVGVAAGRKGVPVGVAVKVGNGVAVLAGREVEISETRPQSVRRRPAKKPENRENLRRG